MSHPQKTFGADPNSTNIDGNSTLIQACRMGNPSLVRHLVDAGATTSTRNQIGCTALAEACKWNNVRCVEELLKVKADASIPVSYISIESICISIVYYIY